MPLEIIEPLTQFGVAGLMGLLWVWERKLSRKRESQLDMAHTQLMRERDQQQLVIQIVKDNTKTVERFDQTLSKMYLILETLSRELQKYHRNTP
jgi:hypothetical protein